MLRGYRHLVIALGLVLASPGHSQEAKPDQAKPDNNGSGQLERIASAVEKLPRAMAPDDGCQPGQDKRESDLCAQWKAADAAAESARWTFWTFFIALIGLVVGSGTLIAAWLAAQWAKKAADFTEAGASAAKEAVAETKRIGEAQVRCYLVAEKARIVQLPNGAICAYCTIHNYGSSPAGHVIFEAELTVYCIDSREGALLRMVKSEFGYSSYVVPPHKDVEMGPVTLELISSDMDRFLDIPQALVTLRASCSGKDVFGFDENVKARFDAMPENGFRGRGNFEMERGSDTNLKRDATNDDDRNREGY